MINIDGRIWKISSKDDEKFLRTKTSPFDFSKYSRKEIDELVKTMRSIMDRENGVGLAANQIGLDMSVFVAKYGNKFYAIFNPKILDMDTNIVPWDGEGCLSIPGKYGRTYRKEKVVLSGFDKNGKRIKIKAWDVLALIFQHEVGHLNGELFIDKMRAQ